MDSRQSFWVVLLAEAGCERQSERAELRSKPIVNISTSKITETTGKFIINPQFDYADDFSEGLAAVRVGDRNTGKWGYIDKKGKFVINPRFDWAFPFSEGLAVVRIGEEDW